MKKKFKSEISYQDVKEQVLKFLFDNNFEEVNRESKININGGFNDFILEIEYKDNFESITDVIDHMELNLN